VPADAVTASGSGLDPHWPEECRTGLAWPERGLSLDALKVELARHRRSVVWHPGRTRRNVLKLNLALDNAAVH
jgi:K+-transporting ATPase c subunit